MTGSVIDALAKKESLSPENICEGTVFLKKAEYISEFKEYCKRMAYPRYLL